MKKYFVVSDIHSCYSPMMSALNEAGFCETDKNHIIVIAGDLFDRGDETIECFNFVKKMIKKKRLIWIKGNHESLLIHLLTHKNTAFPGQHDFSNGTVKTCCHLANANIDEVNIEKIFMHLLFKQNSKEDNSIALYDQAIEIAQKNWAKIAKKCNELKIVDFINKNTINYLEVDNYIIVHSFIPLTNEIYNKDWRTKASVNEWEEAKWKNPFDQIEFGKFDAEARNRKILIFGHWHNCLYRHFKKYPNKKFDYLSPENDYSIVVEKNFIGLDACTPLSKKVNCFVIEKKEA